MVVLADDGDAAWPEAHREEAAAVLARDATDVVSRWLAEDVGADLDTLSNAGTRGVTNGAFKTTDVVALIASVGVVGGALGENCDINRDGVDLGRVLVAALWIGRVRPRLKERRDRARQSLPALPRGVVADRLLPVMCGTATLDESDAAALLRDGEGALLAEVTLVDGAVALAAVRRGLELLGTVPGHRLVRELARRSHDAFEKGDLDARRVSFVGGWSGLADAIRYSTNDYGPLRQIADTGQYVRFVTPSISSSPLWHWSFRRGSRRRSAELAFILGDPLVPGYVLELKATKKNGVGDRQARRLVPELRFEPPVGGVSRAREHGKIWTLHRLLLLEFVDHAEQFVTQGGVRITAARWDELVARAGLPSGAVANIIASWKAGDDVAPPLIVEVEPARFRLGVEHDLEQVFIEESGRRRLEGRASGRAAARRRAERRRGGRR
ncbi:MAG: hypothetical protein EP329_14945 [Deltaproteobacteria bacterium]|nr:MAG: hypothetical protein EP329_14945 [Deltaproteobacteria bacterium]